VNERMESSNATFTFNQDIGAQYNGEMRDGMFHGRGILTLKNGAKIDGVWENGVLVERKYIFNDGLEFNEEKEKWDYCREEQDETKQDRRFHEERSSQKRDISMDPTALSYASSDGIKPAVPGEIQSNVLNQGRS
jgi:hypothetical protein